MEEIWSNFVKVLEPHLGTIISSVITASLSGLFTIFQKKSLRKEVFERLENIGNQFDKSRYQDEYKDLIKQLASIQKDIHLGGRDKKNLERLHAQIRRVTYYAEIIPFCEKDKKTADDFEKKIFDCLSNYEENSKTFNWDILNGEIETIIQLLKRGRLFIHV